MTIEELSHRLDTATEELRLARVELRDEKRWRRWLIGVLAVFAAFLVVVLLAPDWGLVSVANQNQENGDVLVDCTTPGTDADTHECYEEGRARTAEAVRAIDANVRCAFQEALNQTLDRLDAEIEHVQLINPGECFKE